MFKTRTRRDLAVLLAYFFLTLVLTYPLILNFTTHVAGDGSDDPALAWNLWWVRYALLDLGTNPIYTDYMFYPIGLNLGFYTLTYLNAFLSIPFQFVFGLIPAANVNLILSFTLSGFGAYLLMTYLLRDLSSQPSLAMTAACVITGLVYAFSANKFLYASLGQFNIASSQWIPFYILFLLKIFDSPESPLRYGFLLGFFLVAQALAEFTFASFLILFTAAYLVYWLVRIRFQITRQKSKIINLVVAVLVFTLPMSPILAAIFSDLLTEGDFIQQGLGFSDAFSADVLGFFVPSQLHPLFGGLAARFDFPYINFMYLGFGALVLGILAVWKVKPARIWGVWFVLMALISLGPTLNFNGAQWDVPLPFDALLEIPLIKGNRYPSRWSVMLTLCLAVMVGYGVAYGVSHIANRRSNVKRAASDVKRETSQGAGEETSTKRLTFGVLRSTQFATAAFLFGVAALVLFEHLSLPLPLSDFRVPELYAQIASEPFDAAQGVPENFSVMEVPLTWRNGFRVTGSYRRDGQALPDAIFMLAQWYQTAHRHPILNGNTSRNPELKFQYFSETPVLNSLLATQMGHTVDGETLAQDRMLAPRVLQFFGTKYIVWHTPVLEENRESANRTRAYIEQNLPVTKMGESYENGRGVALYRVNAPATSDVPLVLKPDDPLARLYIGEGWGALGDELFWAERNEAKLFVPLTAPRELKLTLQNFIPYPSFGQGLAVRVNGTEIARYNPIQITDGAFSIALPTSALVSGVNEITLLFDKTLPVSDLPDPPVSIVVRSAGEEQGAFGHIYVNGVDASPNARGYNVVVVEPKTGRIQARENFDTFLSGRESLRMARLIESVAEGDLVVVAASDEASQALTVQAVDALKSIGSDEDLRGKFRWSHAIIGVKGALRGSASELISENKVSQLILNLPLTSPTLAATIGEIRVEPAP